ncbi:MAG: sterol-binding protein [Rhodobacterales bacterium CG2_30_65_12]|nr:MAG: sterol-binding protein [Rhodobacterales bacterium CG2_30_65_12]
MTNASTLIPRIPRALSLALRPLPLAPLSFALTGYVRKSAARHPSLIRRLGEHDRTHFVLDPTDLPFVICLDPGAGSPRVRVTRRPGTGAARIAGPLAALIGLVHGAYDGDALFFSRDLMIEGDTAAALALRNAVDDAELDLADDIARMTGPFAAILHSALAFAERRTGVSLSRPEEAGAW